jgi:glycosyltransferase involved in cell wall biosynthesis
MPRASIIIPTKNRRDLLVQTLASVAAQTEPDWEAIIVDDGSTDGTLGYVRAAAREDDRIRLIRRRGPLAGACAARNQGLGAARADVVIFLDSDDILEPFALEARLPALAARRDIDFLVTQARCFRQHPGDMDTLWNVDLPGVTPDEDLDRFLARDIPWQTTGATWRRAALDRLGPWDEHAPSGQDLDFHVRAILTGLRYERTDGYDFHWRAGSSDRGSIGLASIQARHWAYRAVLAERFLRRMEETARLTPRRRNLLAGAFWNAADNVRQRASIRDATKIWDRARVLGLVSARRWIEGSAYLLGFGQRQLREPAMRWIEQTWPPDLRLGPSSTHTLAPVPPTWEAAVIERRKSAKPVEILGKRVKL